MPQTGNTTKLFRIYDQDNARDRLVIDASGNVGIGTSSPAYKLDVSGDLAVSGKIYNYNYTEVDINAPDVVSGTWTTGTSGIWGDPKFNNTYDRYRYNDPPGYVEYTIPTGMKSAYISQLQWSSGGYVDVHGVQSDGGLVFLRRINTRQTVENSNEGNPDQRDGSTITFVGSGLEHYSNIRLTNQLGRFHITGLAFTPNENEGTEGTGMVHSAQISDLGSGIPTPTGTGASGTWGINITGNAGTATTATNQSGGTVSATSYTLNGDTTPHKQSIKNGTNLAVGWYRIAENGNAVDGDSNGNRCSARFTIIDYDSGKHSTRTLYAGGTYGNKPFIHLLTNTSYASDGSISKVRVVNGGVYEGLAVEIYVDTACSANEIRIVMDDNYQGSGFTMVNFESVVADQSGMNEYELDLNTTFWGMFLDNTTKNICMLDNGNVGIGTTSPATKLHVGGTGAIIIPSGTTAQQPTGQVGMLRYNTTLDRLQVHNGTTWITIDGVTATGGTVTNAGGYTIHTFTTSDDFVVTSGGTVEYLIVAGGGGAPGRDVGGGGGAGGMLTGTYALPNGTYAITVGPGGIGKYDSTADVSGMKGVDSSIGSLFTATGGGAGKPHHKALPTGDDNGGSGGGGAGLYDLTAGTGISRQGNNGGNGAGSSVSEYGGGGGGGAGQVGSSATNGRHGGDGIQSSISGTSTYYAGGGGGAGHRSSGNRTEGDGGLGGGGPCNQSTTTSTRNGTDGLGGGGGASRNTGLTGGSGGDGIVIIRYLS
jgi:hypothetical protein